MGACIAAYLVAGAVALAVGIALRAQHPIAVVAWADVAATVVVFCFSFAYRNSSLYDPYWSVAPVPIALYWALATQMPGVVAFRQVLVIALVAAWAARLTANWARGWEGLGHQDWRYVDLQRKSGRAYWLVSFSGIHMFPTLMVFLGCLPLYAALAVGTAPLGILDALAAVVTAAAVLIEATADRQLRRFRAGERAEGQTLRSGLWAYSRHPNYFGEMLFWWGLYLFALAAAPGYWWTIVGPLAISVMFFTVSIPLIEERMQARRPDFAEQVRGISIVVPWFPKKGDAG
jgi:steroid 5-alpha reductase family enzyme